MARFFSAVAAGAALALALVVAPAFAHDTPAIGDAGGARHRSTCEPGSYIVGVKVRQVPWINAIGAVCARWDDARQRLIRPSSDRDVLMFGGAVGAEVSMRCNADEVLAGWSIQQFPTAQNQVGFISPRCRKLSEPMSPTTPTDAAFGTLSEGSPAPRVITCPRGQAAIGLHGGIGQVVYRIGLVCDRAPGVRAPSDIASGGAPIREVRPPSDIASGGTSNRPVEPRPPSDIASGAAPRRIRKSLPICRTGFVPRGAGPNDTICVTSESRARALRENAVAASRVSRNGVYGPNTCVAGFVWREAFNGDVVCVTPEVRALVRQENQLAPSRRR